MLFSCFTQRGAMMLHTCPRISAVLVLCLAYVCLMREKVSSTQTPRMYPQVFSLLTSPSRGVKRLGKGWTDTSVISCANSCSTKYQWCRSFMFNPDTGLCTPGSLYSDTEPLPNMAEGDFYHSFRCDVDKGFRVLRNENAGIEACVGIFEPKMNYSDADATCRSKVAYLASAKTWDKFELLRFRGSRHNLWIGCDDIKEEGTFVWKDDGETFNLSNIPETFRSIPSNSKNVEDCIMLPYQSNKDAYTLNDYRCFREDAVATCEMPLP